MTPSTKNIVAFVAAVVIAGFIWGAYQYPKSVSQTIYQGSPSGTVFNTAKVAAANIAPSVIAASSTSILNSEASTRYVMDSFLTCNGTNGQGNSLQVATTSVVGLGLQGNTNYVANIFGTTTLSSTYYYAASSTEPTPTYTGRLWPTGTYLTFIYGSSTTGFFANNGTCTVGVHYLSS